MKGSLIPLKKLFLQVFFLCLVFSPVTAVSGIHQALSNPAAPQFSADGLSVLKGAPPMVMRNDPNPSTLRRVPLPSQYSMDPSTAVSTFSITYIPAGGTDIELETCATFPTQAQEVFQAAANVWANIVSSAVPIKIKACWANLGDPSILGYSGGASYHRDFSGAPLANTYYQASLANSIYGSDLDPSNEDMHITYNSAFNWYYGLDGQPGLSQHDLFTVVLHEIGHGLHFSGGMYVDSMTDTGKWYFSPYPTIYDTFIKDASNNDITSYSHNSTALRNALTSNALFFRGPKAMAANGGGGVKIYAPSTWNPGSSYSHLDYATFNNTSQQLMVYAISAGEAVHDPGTITRGLLDDLGWNVSAASSSFPWPTFLPAILGQSAPDPEWGVDNYVCCSSGSASFNLTADGVTKSSVLASCSSSATFEGWVKTSPGTKSFSYSLTSGYCGSLGGSFSYTLEEGLVYLFYAVWNSGFEIYVAIATADNVDDPAKVDIESANIISKELIMTVPAANASAGYGNSGFQCVQPQ